VEGKIKIKFANNLNRIKYNRVIWISKNYLDNVKELNDKQSLVTFELEERNKK
jgi:competence transcription factor ComK